MSDFLLPGRLGCGIWVNLHVMWQGSFIESLQKSKFQEFSIHAFHGIR